MKKIPNFSKVIGLVNRGGDYSPSNESSEKKWHEVFDTLTKARGFDERPKTIRGVELAMFSQIALQCGYIIMITRRGLNR